MPATNDLLLFILSGLVLNITPGADTLYIVSRATAQGPRVGAVAALGIGAGCVLHALAAALGLSAVLAASATAFDAVKWLGAAYLVYLGSWLLRRAPDAGPAVVDIPAPTWVGRVFIEGMLTNLLNPKVALFFLAFVPQFIDADTSSKPLTFLILGGIFIFNGTLWCLFVAWAAARFGAGIARSRAWSAWLARAGGALFIALGIRLALTRPVA